MGQLMLRQSQGLGGKKYLARPRARPAAGAHSVTFTISAQPNSNGPFNAPPNPTNSYEFAAGSAVILPPSGNTAGNITGDPVLVNAATIVAIGQISNGNDGFHYNILALSGVRTQGYFTNMTFDDGTGFLYNLASAAANFNTTYADIGVTIWAWQVPVGHTFAPLNLPFTINWP